MLFSMAGGELERVQAFEVEDDEFGKLERTFLAFVDEFIAAKRRAAKLEAEKAAVIAAQAELIDTLAAPAIEVAEGVVAVPIIGELSEMRVARLSESLLERISTLGVSVVILDLSGAEDIDTNNARQLSNLIRAAGLLGARSMVTGVRAELARTLATLGIELGTHSARTLREGLRLVVSERQEGA